MRKALLAVSLVVGLSLLAQAAAAQTRQQTRQQPQQWQFGPEVTLATNNLGLGIGARAVFSGLGSAVDVPGLEAYGAFDYFFSPNAFSSIWEINLNGTWDIPDMTGGFKPYVGAGINYAHYAVPAGSETGLNILGGTHFKPSPKLNMFGEVRIELRKASAVAFTVGLLF